MVKTALLSKYISAPGDGTVPIARLLAKSVCSLNRCSGYLMLPLVFLQKIFFRFLTLKAMSIRRIATSAQNQISISTFCRDIEPDQRSEAEWLGRGALTL